MRNGTFVLADIGGYTTFLTDVGIEHAKEITSHLFNGMFEVDQEAWKVGNVEGDCLFLYSDTEQSPDDLFAYVRQLYVKFRESIEEIASGSTCRCGACDRTGELALKFVVHGGEFDTQQIVGRTELIGSDIVVAHRLLKNTIPAREYALVTIPLADVAKASGLDAPQGRDEYGDIGAVDYVYVDFQGVREAYEKSREVYLTEEDADVAVSVEIAVPPDFVWNLLHDYDKSPEWCSTLIEFETISGTVDQIGSVHTCLHGDIGKVVHFRVGYDEIGRRVTDRLTHVPLVGRMIHTIEVRPAAAGTRVTVCSSIEPGGPSVDDETRALVLDASRERGENDLRGLKTLCESEARGL